MSVEITNTVEAVHGAGGVFRPEGAAGAVWAALIASPGASAAALAEAAGVSRASVGKALARFAEAGRAVRQENGRDTNGKALPDTWTAATGSDTGTGDATDAADGSTGSGVSGDVAGQDAPATPDASGAIAIAAPAVSDAGSDAPAVPDAVPAPPVLSLEDAVRVLAEEDARRAAAEDELARAVAEEETRRRAASKALAKARATEDTRQALADLLASVTTTYAALVAGQDVTAGLEAIQADAAHLRRAARPAPVRVSGVGAGPHGSARGDRKAPEPLRPDVAAHLAAHPDSAFTAGEIAKVLNRSSGAVANALVTLAKRGEAELVSEGPDRYRHAHPTSGDGDA